MKFDRHETDLYVLPENSEENEKVIGYLRHKNCGYQVSYSNVKGNSWYGKRFIDIPFGIDLKKEIESL